MTDDERLDELWAEFDRRGVRQRLAAYNTDGTPKRPQPKVHSHRENYLMLAITLVPFVVLAVGLWAAASGAWIIAIPAGAFFLASWWRTALGVLGEMLAHGIHNDR